MDEGRKTVPGLRPAYPVSQYFKPFNVIPAVAGIQCLFIKPQGAGFPLSRE
jgi:hypothetical protein